MKVFGNVSLQQEGGQANNALAGDGSAQLRNVVIQTLSAFPASPKVGQIAFVNSIVYICVTAGVLPVWVPLTNEITAYTHTQDTPAATWNITHGLNTTSINVQVYDGLNQMVIPHEVQPSGPNGVTIEFGTPAAGKAVILSGHFDGNVKPTYAFEFFQTTASTTWTINHNLGYNPIIRVFIGTQEVQPTSISHPSVNQTIITFTTAQAGVARLI